MLFITKSKRKSEWQNVAIALENIKPMWTDETTLMAAKLMHIPFYNNQWLLTEDGMASQSTF